MEEVNICLLLVDFVHSLKTSKNKSELTLNYDRLSIISEYVKLNF